MRLLLPGGAHLAFARVGQGIGLWETGRFSEAVGGSGGSVPASLVAAGVTEEVASRLLQNFSLQEARDVPPALRQARALRQLGAAIGENLKSQLGPTLREIGADRWERFLHMPGRTPVGSTRAHRLGIDVSVLSVSGMSLDDAHQLVESGRFVPFLAREIARGRKPYLRTLPEDAEKIGPAFAENVHRLPIVHQICNSMRHPLAFRPEIWQEPGKEGVDFIIDGALPPGFLANPWSKVIPDMPTAVALFDRDDKHPTQQAKNDIERYPGFLILRFPTPDLRFPDLIHRAGRLHTDRLRLPRFLQMPDFSLTMEQQLQLMKHGREQACETFHAVAANVYLRRWSSLRTAQLELGETASVEQVQKAVMPETLPPVRTTPRAPTTATPAMSQGRGLSFGGI